MFFLLEYGFKPIVITPLFSSPIGLYVKAYVISICGVAWQRVRSLFVEITRECLAIFSVSLCNEASGIREEACTSLNSFMHTYATDPIILHHYLKYQLIMSEL